ncbi:sialate O-acetylesterase [Alteromonas gilva]|uniref:Sialate O-acetylesterase n=1 Tax=Alteromonas gilva TaxID=2987522 RepID=A0ABT5L346_9ALTE|nr:sialate O-acetylesterase [Alteromonas gilva]MDC8830198.1 sialate O-acetylesterase [Alteromonas gilva]
MTKRLFTLALSLLSVSVVQAVTLSPLFSDHMVLQRDKAVMVWGDTLPGQSVSVSIDGHTQQVQADSQGLFKLRLTPHSKGGPYQLTVTADQTIVLNDVWYGDVWIAGGQSNMEWNLGDETVGHEQEIALAASRKIRFFDVPNTLSPVPETQLPNSEWLVANQDNAGSFSAVAWFFARQLAQQEDVMVGIIESNWGGTPAEAWTDVKVLSSVEGYQAKAEQVQQTTDWQQQLVTNEQMSQLKWQRIGNTEEAIATGAAGLDFDDSEWPATTLPNVQPFHDFTWLRHHFTLTAAQLEQTIEINLGDIVQNAMVFLNGKLLGTEDWRNSDSHYVLPASLLNEGRNVFTVRATNDWDNNAFVGKQGQLWRKIGRQKIDIAAQWKVSNKVEAPMPEVKNYSFTPGFLYNAMIHPLLPFTSTGVIWYQGESNVDQQAYYEGLFEAMITNWRDRAGDAELPFLFVQLAAYLQPEPVQPDSAWAYLRDAQRGALSLPATGMAVAIDVGNPDDIHPRNKRPVGERLWRQAATRVYGYDVVDSGPDFRFAEPNGQSLVLHFDNAKGLQTIDGKAPGAFIIAGDDKVFYPASASIEGNTIKVSSASVKAPVAVRYGWADYPNVNLINNQGLPAVPFRSDTWAASTVSAANDN